MVLHSVLFWRHGEQPPGRASHLILRIFHVAAVSFHMPHFIYYFHSLTLHRSQAWPVRDEPADFFLLLAGVLPLLAAGRPARKSWWWLTFRSVLGCFACGVSRSSSAASSPGRLFDEADGIFRLLGMEVEVTGARSRVCPVLGSMCMRW